MQTSFSAAQLADPATASSERILRTCVHCGFCTATCPTYVLLGDELDSPRGRIYLMKSMLESGAKPTAETVKHVDRCLSCLSCMTTCPSGVHYMHLVDHGRAYIEENYVRPWPDRLLRTMLATLLPYPTRFRLAMMAAQLARPFKRIAGAVPSVGNRLEAMLELAPATVPPPAASTRPGVFPAIGERRGRVVILAGCAQPVLKPEYNEAAIRLLNRRGIEVVMPRGEGCCGALVHHLGRDADSHGFARRNIDTWIAEMDGAGLDAIVITASGCGTTIKDYGFMFRDDPAYAEKARRVSEKAKDITEYIATLDAITPGPATGLVVAYHSACSMQHGQRIRDLPKDLLRLAGFAVKDVPEGHLCCGSAGTYNILQPEIAERLRDRKIANINRLEPDLIATGNVGCATQLGHATKLPIVHTVELLDWASGGKQPTALVGVTPRRVVPVAAA